MLDRRVESPFVGRGRELDQMRGAWEATRTQGVGAILVTGEAGTGKTSLVRAFLGFLPSDHTILLGSCVAQDAGILPYGPFVAALRRLRRSFRQERLEALVGAELAARLETVVPSIGVEGTALPADQARSRLFEAYLDILEALADRSRVVMVLEDLHWIDPPSRDLLRFLLSSLDAPVLLVLTQRPAGSSDHSSELSNVAHFPGVSQLDIGGLDEAGVREQSTSLLRTQPEPELVASVVARTAGVPLYVEALVGPDGIVLPGLPGSLVRTSSAAAALAPSRKQGGRQGLVPGRAPDEPPAPRRRHRLCGGRPGHASSTRAGRPDPRGRRGQLRLPSRSYRAGGPRAPDARRAYGHPPAVR